LDGLSVGGFPLPFRVLVPVVAVLVSSFVADWYSRRRGIDPGPVLWKMLLAGLLAARAAFVVKHYEIYAEAPLDMFDLRDGGFALEAGLVVACVVGVELTRKRAELRKPLLGAFLAGAVVWFGGSGLAAALAPPDAPLPAVEVRRLDGTPVPLQSFAGKPMVVNLWATWCPPCRREMPALRDAQAANPDIAFVFVNQGEQAETIASFLAGERLRMANVMRDPASQVAKATGSFAWPTTLFFDSKGMLVMRHVGELSAATLSERLAKLRAHD